MKLKSIGMIALIFSLKANAESLPEGRLVSPYKACQDVLLVDEEKYQKNKDDWDQASRDCHQKLIPTVNVTISDFANPIKNSIGHLKFVQEIATKVHDNIERNHAYFYCTSLCFEGKIRTCDENRPDKKITQCDERKKEILQKLKVAARKARVELALSRNSSSMFEVGPKNVLDLDDVQLINKNLLSFEIGPSPVSGAPLTEREIKEAQRRLDQDKKKTKEEVRAENLNKMMEAVKRYQKIEKHQHEYRKIIYEENPLLAVIGPATITDGEASWSDKAVAEASQRLVNNAKNAMKVVNHSLKENKLEYSRINGEALDNWILSLHPWNTERNDLLSYMSMKNVVEDYLKTHPELCGVATSLFKRLDTKGDQNRIAGYGGTLGSALLRVGGAAFSGVKGAAQIIGIAENSGLLSAALGGSLILDSTNTYQSTVRDTSLGLKATEDVEAARDNLKMAVGVTALGTLGTMGKSKSALGPTSSNNLLGVITSPNVTRQVKGKALSQWLNHHLDSALETKLLSAKDVTALKSKESMSVMQKTASDILELNPQYFKDKKNTDFFLKTMKIATKKEAGDPADLSLKVQSLLNDINKDAISGAWNAKAQEGLLSVLANSVSELREAFKKDPAIYAKFTSDSNAKRTILKNALKRSGVKSEGQMDDIVQCALPRR